MISSAALVSGLSAALASQAAAVYAGIRSGGWTILDLGLRYPSGDIVAVYARGDVDTVELSDGGETWERLVRAGVVGADYGRGRLEGAIIAICRALGLTLDVDAIVWAGPRTGWIDAAKRICAASLAIDSWRHWMEGA